MDPIRGFALSAVVLLSVVLPLAANAWRAGAGLRGHALRTVWIGQGFGALGGLWIVATPVFPGLGVVAAVAGCLACLAVLRRQTRPAQPSPA